jgi:hypothetical protein
MARKTTDRPKRPGAAAPASPQADPGPAREGGIQPWHLLLVGTVIAVAAGVFAVRGTGTVNAVAVGAAIATVAWAAAAVARTVAPLVTPDAGEQTEMVAGRTRAALEREKTLVLRSIKEVEFDRAMGKISDADFSEMAGRLRARAAGLLRQLDAESTGYRALIERELAARVGRAPAAQAEAALPAGASAVSAPAPGACAACGTENDPDARFCKSCGTRIEAAQ